jgi:hypothetical protein
VAHAALDHLQRCVGDGHLRVGAERGRGHDLAHRRVVGAVGGDHARPQVVVGDDPVFAAQRDHRAADVRVDHAPGGLSDRGLGVADDAPPVHERGHPLRRHPRPDGRGARRAQRLAMAHLAGQVAHPRRSGQQGHDVGRVDPVAERVLGGAGGELGRQAGQHRRVTEQLALAETVEHLGAVAQLDRAAADDADVLAGRRALVEDHRALAEELDLGVGGDLLDLRLAELVKRLVSRQELGDVVHRPILAYRIASPSGGPGRGGP